MLRFGGHDHLWSPPHSARPAPLPPRLRTRFTRSESDFAGDPDAYNDYLEMLEDCVYNLTNDVDVESTEKRIQEYEQQQQQQQQSEDNRTDANGAAVLEPAVYDDAERRRLCAIAGGYDESIVRKRAIAMLVGSIHS